MYLLSCDGYNSITVQVGDWNRFGVDIGEFSVQAREIIMHENYGDINSINNDVCLLYVDELSSQKFGFNKLLIFRFQLYVM